MNPLRTTSTRFQKWLDLHNRNLLSVLLLAAFAWSLFSVDWSTSMMHSGGWAAIRDIVSAFFHPDLSPDLLGIALAASWRTLAYATAGMTLTVLFAIPLGILASGVLSANHPLGRNLSVTVFRGLLGFMRAIHELVWAWLFVSAVGLTPFAAIFALAIPYAGIVGRILADMLNDVPEEPLQALRAAGAGEWQVLLYGRLPMALADVLSYTLYRYECAIRSAAIMSFVGLGGLGYQIEISLADLHYSEVWTFVFFLVILVVAVDSWSTALRRHLVT